MCLFRLRFARTHVLLDMYAFIPSSLELRHRRSYFMTDLSCLVSFVICLSQRYFPGFFPSCYTEQRQNLWRLYADISKKSDDDVLDTYVGAPSPLESLDSVADLVKVKISQLGLAEPLARIFKFGPEPSSGLTGE